MAQATPSTAAAVTDDQLVGLWKARNRFGPDARGVLIVEKSGSAYIADLVGRKLPMRMDEGELTFELPDHQGVFRGKLEGKVIRGHWFRPPTPVSYLGAASLVLLKPDGAGRWRGEVAPLQDDFTFYLLLQKRPDGSLGAVLRNPEFDLGTQQRVERLVREGNTLKLIGKRGGKDRDVAVGSYDAQRQAFTFVFPNRGDSYDFSRDGDDSDFYPRGKNPARYVYRAPPPHEDGWPVGTLEEVNIDRPAMERFIQKLLEMPMDSLDAPQVHGVLVARHGKLVFEEYFHGEHRDKLHGTRSAAKTMTAIVVGAAIQGGAPLQLSSPVYQVMNGGAFPADLEPGKRAMTLDNLLNMASGIFCDDSNDEAPGNEEKMLDQTEEPDYYRFYMRAPMDRVPGEKAVYCSGDPNLALGMVGRATGELPIYSFDRLVGEPMKINTYSWMLDPAGHPYGGGSAMFLPRDFMKMAQLMLNGGTWNGHRILSADFVKRASTPQYHLHGVGYSYLRWSIDYPYKDRTVRALFAGGAGGQAVMAIAELDLVVAIYAGNYSSRAALDVQQNLIPRYILPAVRERGDDPNAPVTEREYKTPYGPAKDSSRISPATAR